MLVLGILPERAVRSRGAGCRIEPTHRYGASVADRARRIAWFIVADDAASSPLTTGPRRGPVFIRPTRMAIAAGIFRQYDIRGIVGKDLRGGRARDRPCVRANLAEQGIAGAVVVSRDNRPSGPAARRAGRRAHRRGVDVIDAGVVPTPLNIGRCTISRSSAVSRSPARTTRPNTTASSCRLGSRRSTATRSNISMR